MDATITLKQYLGKNKTFVIPDYQRGYVWGKNRIGEKNSVENLLDDLVLRYNNSTEVFLQGFTVTEKNDEIILIDGQQRTTCLYLLLKWLGYKNKFDIRYDIREKSDDFLKTLNLNDFDEKPYEEYQDIFFFKKTIRIIKDKLKDVDKKDFCAFLLDKVKFLYINVEERQASKVFAMMNGSKAEMQQEEIIKAEILRLASLNMESQIDYSQEWEHNMLRSRYAREWDNWLHWWNTPNVQSLFQCQNNMGLLISSYLHLKKGDKLTFENFKAECLPNGQPIEAKKTFDGLRRLQKRFEDAYNKPIKHNMIGAILRIFDSDNQKKFIHYYFVEDHRSELEKYYNLAFLEMKHDEITTKDPKNFEEKFEEKFDNMLHRLSEDLLYEDDKEAAFRFLLRLNIDEDNKQNGGDGRVFDFSIWDNGVRSLEHVFPKSKVGHFVITSEGNHWEGGDNKQREKKDFSCFRDDIKKKNGTCQTTEHSIGNLVLLYKGDNSTFSNNDFEDKKNYFFNTNVKEFFNSRHLLHTIYIFANSKWGAVDIAENKERLINQFKMFYNK
ncbi:MAG: DUF262 domain-containing protein [Bacteroidales bacterium]|nr:DUF262 domain-containing protein [Bacteroidales bacterium]